MASLGILVKNLCNVSTPTAEPPELSFENPGKPWILCICKNSTTWTSPRYFACSLWSNIRSHAWASLNHGWTDPEHFSRTEGAESGDSTGASSLVFWALDGRALWKICDNLRPSLPWFWSRVPGSFSLIVISFASSIFSPNTPFCSLGGQIWNFQCFKYAFLCQL